MRDRYLTEDEYFGAVAEAHEKAEREAQAAAELAADLWEFDTDAEREEYIEEYFAAEYERLCDWYEKTL